MLHLSDRRNKRQLTFIVYFSFSICVIYCFCLQSKLKFYHEILTLNFFFLIFSILLKPMFGVFSARASKLNAYKKMC